MKTLRMALLQPDTKWKDAEFNRNMLENFVKEHSKNADVFVFPEMFTTGFVTNPASVAETANGETLNWMKNLAAEQNVALAGSVIISEKDNYCNRFYWVNPDGKFYQYDKKHLFALGRENLEYTSGTQQTIFNYHGWNIKLAICYDLRFPIWLRNSFANDEFLYDILLVTANWPSSRQRHWHNLLVSRAIENQCFAVGVNRKGIDGNGWKYNGSSILANPDGIWNPEITNEDDIIFVELNKDNLMKYRNDFPFARDWDNYELK
ncbi:MAG: nitrilase family protein [Bacteroidales bacterium]|nr:nitrilase family protein [Bacteroidales bacterium]